MNILHILNYSPEFGGGISKHLYALSKLSVERGDELFLSFPKERNWQNGLKQKANVIIIPEIGNPLWSGFRRKVRKICKENSIDIVHIHFTFAQAFSLACSINKWNIPTIYHWHNPPTPLIEFLTPTNTFRGKVKRFFSSLVARFTDNRVISRHISMSKEISDLLIVNKWSSKQKITFLQNGITTLKYKNEVRLEKSNLVPVIGTVANFRPQKDHETLLRAMSILFQLEIKCELWIIGDGPTKAAMENLSEHLGIATSVKFLGTILDPSELFRKFDVFVLSTNYEGHPLVILEAMSFGLPIIATNVSSIPEVITSGTNGLLVNPKDPNDLARAIKEVLSDATIYERLSAAAHSSFERQISVDDWAVKVYSVYNNLLTARSE